MNPIEIQQLKRPVSGKLPAGLLDSNLEFFTTGDCVYALWQGSVIPFDRFPEELKEIVERDMNLHPDVVSVLIEMDFVERDKMLWQYIRCRFGAFDGEPDLVGDNLKATEYWECGLRGKCPYEGRLCPGLKAANGNLTQREIQVLKLIAEGLLDKEIASKLNISVNTVPVFTKHIRKKTGLDRKPDLVRFAINKNLI